MSSFYNLVQIRGCVAMLNIVKNIDEDTINNLLDIYCESMEAMESSFDNHNEMIDEYISFIKDFINKPQQLIMVEEVENIWVSGLRAIETEKGKWFFEAVETKPSERHKGYGKKLLQHSVACLEKLGMTEITCTISEHNLKSKELHKKCGFIETNDSPINPWGEFEEGRVLYRFRKDEK